MKLFFLIEEDGSVWLRGQRKIGTITKKAASDDTEANWERSDVKILPRIADVAWSENESAIVGPRTWLITNVKFKLG